MQLPREVISIIISKYILTIPTKNNVLYDKCAICRNYIYNICIDCCFSNPIDNEMCRTRKLDCYHIFHKYCLNRWLKTKRQNCPLCNYPIIS